MNEKSKKILLEAKRKLYSAQNYLLSSDRSEKTIQRVYDLINNAYFEIGSALKIKNEEE